MLNSKPCYTFNSDQYGVLSPLSSSQHQPCEQSLDAGYAYCVQKSVLLAVAMIKRLILYTDSIYYRVLLPTCKPIPADFYIQW